MKRDIFKYIGLGLIVVVLVFANTTMVYKTFFAKNRPDPNIKKVIITTNEQIKYYAESIFIHTDSLKIIDDEIENNKQIITEKDDTLGFSYIINEPINCPSCSEINYLLFTDREYTIRNIIFLRDIIENYKIVPIDTFKVFSNQFLNKNFIKDDFNSIKTLDRPKKHSKYFKESIRKLQGKVKLFYEK